MKFQWPNTSQRTLVLGKTGSGKSVLAAHILSYQPIRKMPFIIVDFKRDELLNNIPYARYLDLNKQELPKQSGVYILQATPVKDDNAIESYLLKVLVKERVGLFFDEGYMMPDKVALNALYTQGRSKNIPIITLSQRPVWLSRFAFSEADHFAYMHLNDERDRKTVRDFVPSFDNPVWNLQQRLPAYYSRWYDVARDYSFVLKPSPTPDDILTRFEDVLHIRKSLL